jgi:hypothetical protein
VTGDSVEWEAFFNVFTIVDAITTQRNVPHLSQSSAEVAYGAALSDITSRASLRRSHETQKAEFFKAVAESPRWEQWTARLTLFADWMDRNEQARD